MNRRLLQLFYTLSVFVLIFSCKQELLQTPLPLEPSNDSTTTTIAQNKKHGYSIEGTTFVDADQVYLFKRVGSGENVTLIVLDSAVISNGTFKFEGSVTNPEINRISTSTSKKGFPVLIDNSTIKLFLNEAEQASSIMATTTLQNQYIHYNKKIKEFQEEGVRLYYNLKGNFSDAKIVQLKKDRSTLFSLQERYIDSFLKNNPNSYYSLLLVKNRLLTHDATIVQKQYNYLSDSLKATVLAKSIDSTLTQLERNTKIVAVKTTPSSSAPPKKEKVEYRPKAYALSGTNTNGATLSLSSLRGKVVLIDFWASWCAPCRATNPNLVRLYKKYKNDGFTILSVSEDKGKPEWLAAIQNDNLTWNTHILDNTKAIAFRYGVQSIPYKILIDKKGNIASGKISGAALERRIKELLNE